MISTIVRRILSYAPALPPSEAQPGRKRLRDEDELADPAADAYSSCARKFPFRIWFPSIIAPAEIPGKDAKRGSDLLRMIPREVLSSEVLTFLSTLGDWSALQATCRVFRELSDGQMLLSSLALDKIITEVRKTSHFVG